MIADDTLARLSKSKDADVKEIVSFYGRITRSKYYKGYITLLDQLNDKLKQLTIVEIGKDEHGKPIYEGQIDLFSSKDEKSCDREKQFWDTYEDRIKTLEFLWSKMTEDEQKEAVKKPTSLIDDVREEIRADVKNGKTKL